MKLNSPKAQAACQIIKTLNENNFVAYFAGGSVRDSLMGKTPNDFDIATTATPEKIEKIFPKTIPVGKQFGVMIVLIGEDAFEVASFRCEGGYQDGRHPTKISFTEPKEDALRRDFTVNGMFFDPIKMEYIDFVGGAEDIDKKVIRAIGNPDERFEEDKLRLLRAVRFASTLGFEIEKQTWLAIKRKAKQIEAVSPERIREELVKIFTRSGAARGMRLLSESGLLAEILPEIEKMKGVEQPLQFHPEGDVYNHTLLLLENFREPVSTTLAFAALFHDIGKPDTLVVRDGKQTFYEHAEKGAEMARDIMKRLRFSNAEIEAVSECVLNHMKFIHVKQMRPGKLKQFMSRQTFADELELHRLDCVSCHGMLDNYNFLTEKLKNFTKDEIKPKPIINGDDLIALGVKPGPEMKPILEEAFILQLEGKFEDREAALKWLKEYIEK